MNRVAKGICVVLAVAFASLALIESATLARFFTHEALALRAGVEIRPVTLQGAEWFRAMCVASALAWIAIPWILARVDASRSTVNDPIERLDAITGSNWATRLRIALLFVLVIGLALRLWRIAESFWFDEITTLIDYAQYGPGPILGTYFVQSNHVLHTLLSWCAVTMAGVVSEPILRAPAFFAGLAAIGAIVVLVREAALWQQVATRSRMAVGCALAALSPIMVLESVEARGYSMMILFSALASAVLLRGLGRGGVISWIGYAMICVLGVWSHLVFVVVPFSHALVAIWVSLRPRLGTRDRKGGLSLLLAIVLAAITSVTVLAPLFPDLMQIRGEFQALDGNEPSIFSREGFHVLLGLGGAWSIKASILPLFIVLVGIAGLRMDSARRIPLAVTLLGLPILALGTELGGGWMYARFALFALPGIFLAMTMGAFDSAHFLIHRRVDATRVRALTAGGAILIAAFWVDSLYKLPAKQPIRDAVLFAQEQSNPGDKIASVGLADNVVAYYALAAGLEIHDAGMGGSEIDSIPPDIHWLIAIYPRSVTDAGNRSLDESWTLVRTFPGWVDWDNGDVLVYRRDRQAQPQ